MSERTYSKHGLTPLKDALYKKSKATKVRLSIKDRLDLRFPGARGILEWQAAVIRDAGGPESVTTNWLAILDTATRERIFLKHLDEWLLGQRSLIVQKRRAVLPVLRERMTIADSYIRHLQILGIERREQPALTLQEYLEHAPGEEDAKPSKTMKGQPGLEEYMERKPAEAESESEPDADEAEDSKGELREVDWEDIAEEVDDDQM